MLTKNVKIMSILLLVCLLLSLVITPAASRLISRTGVPESLTAEGSVFDPSFTMDTLPALEDYFADYFSAEATADSDFRAVENLSLTEYVAQYDLSEEHKHSYWLRIDTAAELYLFSQLTNDLAKRSYYLDCKYILGNNIDYAPYFQQTTNYFVPIGTGESTESGDVPFTGAFDGQGFEISNLYFAIDQSTVNANRYFAMFGANKGTIRNFGLVNPIINATAVINGMLVSGLVGKNLSGGVLEFAYVIDNRTFSDDGITTNDPGYRGANASISGLVSYNQSGALVSNVYYSGPVVAAGSSSTTIRPVIMNNEGLLDEAYYNKSEYQIAALASVQSSVAASSKTFVTISAEDAALFSVGQTIIIGRNHHSDDIATKTITGITDNGDNKNLNFSGALTTTVGQYISYNYADTIVAPSGSGTGTVVGVNSYHLERRTNCLQDDRWRTHAYETVNASDANAVIPLSFMRSTPKLQGFAGWVSKSWGSANSPFKLLTPADLIYFTQFMNAGDATAANKKYHLDACIDMSSVSAEAYHFTQITATATGFAFYGTADGGEACAAHHVHTSSSSAASHAIVNLTMVKPINSTIDTSVASMSMNNVDMIGFIPAVSNSLTATALYDVNFIGGLVAPPANKAATVLLAGTAMGLGSLVLDNVHSSMDVIIADGETSPVFAGGIMGYQVNHSSNLSYSGHITGGVHPYPVSVSKNYSIGGISGGMHSLSYTNTNIVSNGRIEGVGFYNIPLTDGQYMPDGETVYSIDDARVLLGGLYGGLNVTSTSAQALLNYSDIYSVPMVHTDDDELVPQTGPDGQRVYSVSASIGGLGSYGEYYTTSNSYLLNHGNIYAYNLIGRSSVAGILGTSWRVSHGKVNDKLVNFGSITIYDSDGEVYVSGILNKITGGVATSFDDTYNFGDITVAPDSRLDIVLVGGISTQHRADKLPAFAVTNTIYNYGDITVTLEERDCDLYVAGLVAAKAGYDGTQAAITAAQNHGDITINTAQTGGVVQVSGMSHNSYVDSANTGDISVTAASALDIPIYVGGITGFIQKAISYNNVVNAGQVTVTANTSGIVYVGGLSGTNSTNTSINNSWNNGDVIASNTGGSLHVGGIHGYFLGTSVNYVLIDNINSGDVTATLHNGIAMSVGGIAGTAYGSTATNGKAAIQNNLNYGTITSHSTGTNAVKQQTGGILGAQMHNPGTGDVAILRSTGNAINYGTVRATTETTNTANIATGGIIGWFSTNVNMSFVNVINNGAVTQSNQTSEPIGSSIGAIAGHIVFPTGNTVVAVPVFANHLNTIDGLNLYGTNSAMNTTFANLAPYNLVNVYASDKNIGGTATATIPYQGHVTYLPNTIEGIYAEGNPFVTSTANTCFIYHEPSTLAIARLDQFDETGMYALTTNTGFGSGIYLPETLKLDNISGLSLDKQENEQGIKDNSWRTENRVDTEGNTIADSSINAGYDFIKQVDNEPVIITLTLKSEALANAPAYSFDHIQKRDYETNTLYFYTTENMLGREFTIDSWTTNMGRVAATDTGDALSGVKFTVPATYNDTIDPREIDVEATVYLIPPNGSDYEPIEYTIKLVFIPNPVITLTGLKQTTIENKYVQQDVNINTLQKDGDTYVVSEPIYYAGSSGGHSLLSVYVSTENISNGYVPHYDATITHDETNVDYTQNYYVFDNSPYSVLSARYIENASTDKYYSGTNPLATSPVPLTGALQLYTSSFRTTMPGGWYTLRITINNTVLLSIRFQRKVNTFGFPLSPDSMYALDFDALTATRNNSSFGLSTQVSQFYPFGSTSRSNDTLLYPTKTDLNNSICTEGERLLTDIIYHTDTGTHTYINKVGYIPESGEQDTTWWTVITHEGLTGTMSFKGMRLNGTQQGDGTVSTVNTSAETKSNKIAFNGLYNNIDMSATNNIEFLVKHTIGGVVTELTRVNDSSVYAPKYSINGVEVLTITQIKTTSANAANAPSGEYSYEVTLSKNAPSGTYEIFFVYKRQQTVSLDYFDDATKQFIKKDRTETVYWQYTFPTPLTIVSAMSDDSYLKGLGMDDVIWQVLECTTPKHVHETNPITIINGVINYATTVTSGDNRATHFSYSLYFNPGTDFSGKFLSLTVATGAAIYRKAIDGTWESVEARHEPNFAQNQSYEYKIVSEDGVNTTYYTFHIDGLPRNKTLNLEASVGVDAAILQQLFATPNGEPALLTLKQFITDTNGNFILQQQINGAFVSAGGAYLTYSFPLISAGVYVVDLSLPDGYSYTLSQDLSKLDITETLDGVSGYMFTITNVLDTQLMNLWVVITKDTEEAPQRLGAQSTVMFNEMVPPKSVEPGYYDITFTQGGELFTQLAPDTFPNAIITPRKVGTSESSGSCFARGDVTIPVGVTVKGDIYTTGSIYVNGAIVGNVDAGQNVYGSSNINGTVSANGSIYTNP